MIKLYYKVKKRTHATISVCPCQGYWLNISLREYHTSNCSYQLLPLCLFEHKIATHKHQVLKM